MISSVASPSSAAEALEMLRSALGYLATVDATAMAAETQAHCLQMLEQAHSMYTAARTSVLAAFTAGQGYCADADYSPRAWLINRTKVTKGAAVGYTAWVRRAAAHPGVAAVLPRSDQAWLPGRWTPGGQTTRKFHCDQPWMEEKQTVYGITLAQHCATRPAAAEANPSPAWSLDWEPTDFLICAGFKTFCPATLPGGSRLLPARRFPHQNIPQRCDAIPHRGRPAKSIVCRPDTARL